MTYYDHANADWKYTVDSFERTKKLYESVVSVDIKERLWCILERYYDKFPKYLSMPKRAH